jgi:RHS repeat-associated protein
MWQVPATPPTATQEPAVGSKLFELSNHLGNVLATLSDKKLGYDTTNDGQVDYFLPDVRQVSDYHPFGMAMNNRTFTYNLLGYKYGFNGKENDKETTTQDYGMRIYDPRLARFLSVDPLIYSYPYYSSYQFAGNMPIAAIDLDGLEQYVVIYEKNKYGKLFKTSIYSLKVGTDLKDQEIKRVNAKKERIGDPVASGNILVFESSNSNNLKDKLSLVDKRNTPDSKLSPQELEILKANSKLINSTDTRYEYPDIDKPQFASNDFLTPKFYEASKIEPLAIQGFAEFNVDGFKIGNWKHGREVNGKIAISYEFDDYLSDIKKDGSVKTLTVTLNLFSLHSYSDREKENVKREYRKHVSQVTGISFDKVTINGKIEKGDSNKSTIKIQPKP